MAGLPGDLEAGAAAIARGRRCRADREGDRALNAKIVGKLPRRLQDDFRICMQLSIAGGILTVRARCTCEESRAVRDLIGLGLRFLKNDSGATAIEYALIAGSISIVIVAAATAVGTSVRGVFTNVSGVFK
jgi:pilus assembly protein Flp/PilA